MQATAFEVLHLRVPAVVGAAELARMCGMAVAEIAELVEYGALVPLERSAPGEPVFSAAWVPALRTAAALRGDFDLDLFTVSLLFGYLQRIAELEQHVRTLEAQLPRPHQASRDGPALWREPHS